MARYIPTYLSGILEDLELERPELVSLHDIRDLCQKHGVRTEPRIVAARLKEHGWILQTPQRGVWEFAPAELAGAYSSADPLIPIKAFAKANPSCSFALSAQTAAWALGLAGRVPSIIDVAFERRITLKIPYGIHASVFKPHLSPVRAKGTTTLVPESIIVAMCSQPSSVRTWQGADEWLGDVAYEMSVERTLDELVGRAASVALRTGYLIQAMRPDIAQKIKDGWPHSSSIRFGRGQARRYDKGWHIVDSTLPFDPRKMERVR